MPGHNFRLQMQSYDLTAADIDYRLPDIRSAPAVCLARV